MKKITSFVLLLGLFAGSLSAEKKVIVIDNLYKIEFDFDKANNSLKLRLFSDNSAAFDEQYAFDNIEEELSAFISENGYEKSVLVKSSIDGDFEEKYTLLTRNYNLQ